jgi:glycosyltransferase involved in cell wall biosynthesis
MRLGIYADLLYRRDKDVLSTDLAFALFLFALAERVEELVVFGRVAPGNARASYVLPRRGVRFVPLPHYPRTSAVVELLRGAASARRTFAAELGRLDAVWLFGPHPLSLEFARLARRRRVPVVLGVRQDFPSYVKFRIPSRRWLWTIPAAHVLERLYRLLARQLPTVVVGQALAAKYVNRNGRTLVLGISLLRKTVSAAEALAKDWSGELLLLSVGRLEPEKNPRLLPAVLAHLRAAGGRWRLVVVGEGSLAAELAATAAALGVIDRLELRGALPLEPELLHCYRESHAFLHVSLTEGVPQVLYEAQASGLPIVATDVGGVRAALGDGARALLVPPGDAAAAAAACERLRCEPELRRRLVLQGLEQAERDKLDVQLDRLYAFLCETVSR